MYGLPETSRLRKRKMHAIAVAFFSPRTWSTSHSSPASTRSAKMVIKRAESTRFSKDSRLR